MELTSLSGVSKTEKISLQQVRHIDEFTRTNQLPQKSKEKVVDNDVLKEIVRNLGKYPPIKTQESEKEALTIEEVREQINDETFSVNIDSLTDVLIDFI